MSTDQRVTIKYVSVGILVVLLTWIIHEFTHWLTSELLGHEAIMQLNGTSVVKGSNPSRLEAAIISISAPIITILQGMIAFAILKSRNWNKYVYTFLFTAFYMRFLAGIMNVINLNDEGRVSAFLGIGTYTLPIIVSGLLFYMVYSISRKYEVNWKFQLLTTLIVMVSSSTLILVDQFFRIRLL